jgi:hypothetical protein
LAEACVIRNVRPRIVVPQEDSKAEDWELSEADAKQYPAECQGNILGYHEK